MIRQSSAQLAQRLGTFLVAALLLIMALLLVVILLATLPFENLDLIGDQPTLSSV